ncbi:perlucin-like protein [Pomacea canaliculata]|uniref:perlucin-like protein n=1 Tax=Pomacea canaliculata TaxID=400727 RepID=UPI000D733422|nr:perlucin-like protein [Pomacea canaliculata]
MWVTHLSAPTQVNMSSATLLLLLALGGVCHCFRCPPSWVPYGNSCYTYISQSLTWPDAANRCRAIGGYLVEITSRSENNFVQSLIGRSSVWMGINKLRNGRWVLTSSGRPLPYANWARGEPNNYRGRETCGQMYSNGRWNDHRSSHRIPSVCERSAFSWCH